MDKARSAALYTLNRCFKSGAWSSLTLDSVISKNAMSEQDSAFATFLTFGVIRNYRLLDYWIDSYSNKIKDIEVRNILRLGAFQINCCNSIPDSAAVNECVQLCKTSGFKSASGLVNAILRKISSAEIQYPESLAVKYSHPDWFVDKFLVEKGAEFTEQLLISNNSEAPLCYHEAFSDNQKYVQDEAAYKSIELLDVYPGASVLDACAAPGGKSFTLAKYMENKGSIVSCDIHNKKLKLISENAERLGINIIKTRCLDASSFEPGYDKFFDFVVADVPCSGFGVIRKKPEIRFKSYEDITGLPEIQFKILENVSRYLKSNGKLLYSTCTIFREENENVVRRLSGFEIIDEKTFYPNVDGTDGFYACYLKKK